MRKILLALLMILAVPAYAQLDGDTAYDRLEKHLAYCNTKSDSNVLEKAYCSRTWAVLDQNERLTVMEALEYPDLFNWYAVDANGDTIGAVERYYGTYGDYRALNLGEGNYVLFQRTDNTDFGSPILATTDATKIINGPRLWVDDCANPSVVFSEGASLVADGELLYIVSGVMYNIDYASVTPVSVPIFVGGFGDCSDGSAYNKTANSTLIFYGHTSDYPGPWTFTYERK